jgi:hypothetical protein
MRAPDLLTQWGQRVFEREQTERNTARDLVEHVTFVLPFTATQSA